MAERGVTVSCEPVRQWRNKFCPEYANGLKCRHQGFGDTFYIDERFVKIGGQQPGQKMQHRLQAMQR